MMETCTQEGHPGWKSGKASWRKGQLTQELAKCTDKEKSVSSGRKSQARVQRQEKEWCS